MFLDLAYDLSRVKFSPDLVIDCGAYEGYFTLLAKSNYRDAKCVAYEPDRANYAALLENLALNGIRDVDVHHAAVSTFEGTCGFVGSGFGGRLAPGHAHEGAVSVDVVDIRRLIENHRARRLLLKIDVEGEEEVILPGILERLPATCAIFFEWHQRESDYVNMEEALKRAGFSVVRLRTRIPDDDDIAFIDALAQRCATSIDCRHS